MIRPRFLASLALVLALVHVVPALAIESNFASGDEGWVSAMLPWPSALPTINVMSTYPPIWSAGQISLQDPDGTAPTGNAQYWQAPAKFTGDLLAYYGDSLAFDVSDVGSGWPPFQQEDVILAGNGTVITYSLPVLPLAVRTHCAAPLTETGWHRDNASGPVPTHAEFTSTLGAVSQLFIRAEYQLGADFETLYHVVLGTTRAGVPAGIDSPSLALSAPFPNPGAGTTRLALSMPAAGEADAAVFDVSGRRVATLAHGTLGAGVHALAWDGRDAGGHAAGPGLFWVRVSSSSGNLARRIVRVE